MPRSAGKTSNPSRNYSTSSHAPTRTDRSWNATPRRPVPRNPFVRPSAAPKRHHSIVGLNANPIGLTTRFIASLQFRVLNLRSLQDWNLPIGLFPQRQKLLISCHCPNPGRLGLGTLQRLRL
jgi:hypothetical protein